MTHCHFSVKRSQNTLKIGARDIFGSGSSNITSDFEIDQNFTLHNFTDAPPPPPPHAKGPCT